MSDLRAQATRYRTALLLGLCGGDEVIAWADAEIAARGDVPHALLDVSLTPPTDLSALRIALQPLAEEHESPAVVREMLVRVNDDLTSGRRTVADTVKVFAQMRRMLPLESSLAAAFDAFEDDHMLAVHGVRGDVGVVESSIVEWMRAQYGR